MISIEFNDAEIQAALSNLVSGLTDMSPVMNDIGIALVASTEARFDATQAPDGSPWAARSEVTLAKYAREGGSFGPVLHRSGTLRSFIHHAYGPDQVTVGSNTLWAAVQQFGAAKGSLGPASPWGNIPARPYIGLSDSDRTGVLDIVGEWLGRVAAGAA